MYEYLVIMVLRFFPLPCERLTDYFLSLITHGISFDWNLSG